MEQLRYRLTSGRLVERNEVNMHHVFFERRLYRSAEEKQFRCLGGLALMMHIPVHRELHADVKQPPKPCPDLRGQIREFANSIYDEEYEAFYRIAHFIGDVANTSRNQQIADQAYDIFLNLGQQSTYIQEGRVEEVYGER
jgi:hypothetical protein